MKKRLPATALFRPTKGNPSAGNAPSAGMLPPGTKSRHSVPLLGEIASPGTNPGQNVPQPRKIATPGTKLPRNVPQLQKKHTPGTNLPRNVPYTKMISFVGKGVLFDYAQLLANLCECGNGLVQMLPLVSGRNLNTDTGLVLRNYRVVETYYINTLVQKFLGHLL